MDNSSLLLSPYRPSSCRFCPLIFRPLHVLSRCLFVLLRCLLPFCPIGPWNIPSLCTWKCVILGPGVFNWSFFITALFFLQCQALVGSLTGEKGESTALKLLTHGNQKSSFRLQNFPQSLSVLILCSPGLGKNQHSLQPAWITQPLVMETLSCRPQHPASSSMVENTTMSTSTQLWLLFQSSRNNHLFNQQFMLWYHTKHGINISGQTVSPLLGSALSWDHGKIAFQSLTWSYSGSLPPHAFCLSLSLLLRKIAPC